MHGYFEKKQNAPRKEYVFLSVGSEMIIQFFAGEYHLKFLHFHCSMNSIIYGFVVWAPLKGARSFLVPRLRVKTVSDRSLINRVLKRE